MKQALDKKKAGRLIFLCWLVYTSAYIGRLNYPALLVEIVSVFDITKAQGGVISSFFFFSYGAGQLVNGILCKRYNSKVMIFISLILSSLFNFLFALCGSIEAMKYIWALNGFSQSILWSSLIKLLSDYLPKEHLKNAVMAMSSTVVAGTFIAYGLSSLFVSLNMWKIVFLLSSLILVFVSVIWITGVSKIQNKAEKYVAPLEEKSVNNKKYSALFIIMFVLVFLSAIANGFIKDGVVVWVPSLLFETYNIEKHFSILITLMLPLIAVFGTFLVQLAGKKIKSSIMVNALFFLFAAFSLLLIFLFLKKSMITSLAAFSLVACLMAGINNILTSLIPFKLRGKGKSGLTAGVINTFCYTGSTLSSFILGFVAQSGGWINVIALLLLISLAVFGISMLVYICNKFTKKAQLL
jgi:OPA family glycerol-3-phosphate transporter-like MFS transporter